MLVKTMAVVSFWAAPAQALSTLTQPQQKTIAVVKDAPILWLATTTLRFVWTMVHAAQLDFALDVRMKTRATTSQTPRWIMALVITSTNAVFAVATVFCQASAIVTAMLSTIVACAEDPASRKVIVIAKATPLTSVGSVVETERLAWDA